MSYEIITLMESFRIKCDWSQEHFCELFNFSARNYRRCLTELTGLDFNKLIRAVMLLGIHLWKTNQDHYLEFKAAMISIGPYRLADLLLTQFQEN
jgi:hypothetical protein